jgi:hypothetical protein
MWLSDTAYYYMVNAYDLQTLSEAYFVINLMLRVQW